MSAAVISMSASKNAPANEPVIYFNRVFDAPRDLVWKVCTDPAHVKQWWGAGCMEAITCELDVRTGGAWRIEQRGPDGNIYVMWGEYLAVVKPEKIVHTQRFLEYPAAIVTITLDEQDGRTKYASNIRFESLEQRDGALSQGMEQGANRSLDRIADILKTL